MKLYSILLLCFCLQELHAQTSVYDIDIKSLDSTVIRLSAYKGRKVLIAVVSPSRLYRQKLKFLDSLLDTYPSLVVLAIPSSEFGDKYDLENLTPVRVNRMKRVIVSASGKVKKAALSQQNGLVKWLTNVSENTHFDGDVLTDDQLYIISESGELYAMMEKGVPLKAIRMALDMKK